MLSLVRLSVVCNARAPYSTLQPAGLCFAPFTSFVVFFLFNDRLDQRDLGNCKTDLQQIFRGGRHVMRRCVDVKSGIAFPIGQWTLPWQPILGAKSAKSATRIPSWDSQSTTDDRMGKRMGALTA